MTEKKTQPKATAHLAQDADGRICGMSITEYRPELVFGMPEVFRIKPDGSVELAEGKELNDAARAFWHAVAQMRSTNGTPATLSARQETRPGQVGEVQGDARSPAENAAILRAMASNYSGDHCWDHLDAEVCTQAADALAARQSVAQVPEDAMAVIVAALEHSKPTHAYYHQPVKRHADALAHARALVARQQVVQEPIGYRWRHSAGEKWQYSDAPCGWEHEPLYAAPLAVQVPVGEVYQGSARLPQARLSKPLPVGTMLYAAPPAQGIDLGQLRELAESWKGGCDPDPTPIMQAHQRANHCCADELLALIGQRDAAPGVGS